MSTMDTLTWGRVAELVDALASGASEHLCSWRVKSSLAHQNLKYYRDIGVLVLRIVQLLTPKKRPVGSANFPSW